MTLRPLAFAGALTVFAAGAALAQTTSPALTPSSGGQGDTATASKSPQDPTLGAGATQPKTPRAARPHRHHSSSGAMGGASSTAPAGMSAPPPTLPDSSSSSAAPGPGL